MTPTSLVSYLALFGGVAVAFVLVALLLGRLLRPNAPSGQKLESYECGEPPVGGSFVQFDLRFYVVALVFIIFEVEVALFFPAAAVFGKATHLMRPEASADAKQLTQALHMEPAGQPVGNRPSTTATDARTLALAAMADLGAFFAVILVGFAYVWFRGDLDWVRALSPPSGELKVRN